MHRTNLSESIRNVISCLFFPLSLLLATTTNAADGTWSESNPGIYSWDDAARWLGGAPADGAAFTANFNTINPTGDITINLDVVSHSLGQLIFGDTDAASAAGWTIGSQNGNVLTMDNTFPNPATITVNALAAGKQVTISAPLNSFSGLIKAGTGTLALTNTVNSISGGVTVSGGTLSVSAASLGGNDVANSANLTFDQAAAGTYSNVVSGNGILTKTGGGVLTLGVDQTYTGATIVNGGGLTVSGSLASQSLVMGGGTLSLGSASATPVNFALGTTVNGPSSINASLNLGTAALGALTRSAGGAVNLVLPTTAPGVLTTTSTNTNGILGGWAVVNGTDYATSNSGSIAAFTGYINDIWAAGNNTKITQPVSSQTNATTNTLRIGGDSDSVSITYGAAAAGNSIAVSTNAGLQVRALVQGTNIPANTRITAINGNTVTLSNNVAITPDGTPLTFGTLGATTINLSGVNSVAGGGILTNTFSPAVAFNGGSLTGAAGGGDVIFHQFGTASGTVTVNSTIADNGGAVGIVKNGTGAVILNADNTYTGNTSIGAGTLQVGNGGSTGSINLAGNVTNNGTLAFNRSGSLTLTKQIVGGGTTSIVGNFALTSDYEAATAPASNMLSTGGLTSSGGAVNFIGKASSANSQSFTSTTIGTGTSRILATSGAAGTFNLSLGTYGRTAGATAVFSLPASGSISVTGATTGQLLGGNGRPHATLADATGKVFDLAAVDVNNNLAPATTVLTPVSNPNTGTNLAANVLYVFNNTTNTTANVASNLNGIDAMLFNTHTTDPNGWRVSVPVASRVLTWRYALVTPDVGAANAGFTGIGAHRVNGEGIIDQYNTLGTFTIAGSLSSTGGGGHFTKGGPGTLVITANASYAGQTFHNGGVIQIGANNNISAQQLNLNGGTLLGSASFTTAAARNTALLGNGGGLAATAGNTLTIGGLITGSNTGPLTIGIPASSANSNTLGLVPGTGAGTANPTPVFATGTVALPSANTYTGGTIVSSGTLLALNTTGSATGSGSVTVNSGGSLGGNGTISGLVTIASGGHLSSGIAGTNSGIGSTLSLGGLNLLIGSAVDFDMSLSGNDLITLTNGLIIGSGAGVNLFQAGTSGGYGINGNYNLFKITSGTIPSVGDLQTNLAILNPLAGGSYTWGVNADTVTLTIGGLANASTWITNGGGAWTASANWSPAIPNNAGDSASFGNALLTGNANITLDGDKSVGTLIFNNTNGASYSINQGSSGSLRLNNNASTATVTVANGTHAITSNVILDSNATFAAANAADSLTVSGNVSGAKDVTVANGSGKIILTGSNTHANTAVDLGGTLQIGNGGTTGTLGVGNITTNGSVVIKRSDAVNLTNSISGSGRLVQDGTGSITIAGTTNTGSWGPTVNSGTLVVGTGSAFGSGGVIMTGGLLDLNGYSPTISSLAGTGGTIDNVSAGGTVNITVNQVGPGTFGGTIANTSGTVSLTKAGTGNLTLSGTGTYDGNTTVLAGGGQITLASNTAVKSGTTVVVQNPGGLLFGGNATVPANINPQPGGSNQSMFDVAAGSHSKVTANVSYTNIGGGSARFAAGNDAATTSLTIGGNANFTSPATTSLINGSLIIADNANVAISAALNFGRSGNNTTVLVRDNARISANGITLNDGNGGTAPLVTYTMQDNADVSAGTGNFHMNGGATSAVVNLNGGALRAGALSSGGTTALNFNGTTLIPTVNDAIFMNTLATTTANVQAGGVRINTSGFNVSIAQPFFHDPALDTVTPTPDGGLTKSGSGRLTLSGFGHTYNGPTTISGGQLLLQNGEAIGSTNKVALSGGVLETGGMNQTLSLAPLQLTANSAINLGEFGVSALQFANSSSTAWTPGETLSIINWTGTHNMGGTPGVTDQLLFGTGGLTAGQVSQIHFQGYTGATLLPSGEVVPLAQAAANRKLGNWSLTDTVVDASDIAPMLKALIDLNAWKSTNALSNEDFLNVADVNGSGTVTNSDLQATLNLIANLGFGSVAAVPEPSAFILLSFAVPAAWMVRRRSLRRVVE